MGSQFERMITHQLLCYDSLPLFDGFNNPQVINDRLFHAIAFSDGANTNSTHVNKETFSDITNQFTICEINDGLMECNVGIGILIDIGMHCLRLIKCGEKITRMVAKTGFRYTENAGSLY